MFLLLVLLTFVYVSDKIGINDTILTKYENSNAISDLAFQKTLRPGVWTAEAATTMNISSLTEEQRKARDSLVQQYTARDKRRRTARRPFSK